MRGSFVCSLLCWKPPCHIHEHKRSLRPSKPPDLPCWELLRAIANIIQVAAHADLLVFEAVLKGFTGFDPDAAWDAVYKDATVPPIDDTTTS